MNNVRVSPKSANQTNEMTLAISNSISRNCCRLMRDWKLESLQNGKEISAVPSKWKKRSTSGGNLQSLIEFPQKSQFHFTFNRNFRIMLLNGKHPNIPENLFKNCTLPTVGVLFSRSEWNSGNFLTICYIFHFPVSQLLKTIANGKRHLIWLVSWFLKNF